MAPDWRWESRWQHFLLGRTVRTILYPIKALTESATAIGKGNLDQLVSVSSDDEIGELAAAFNQMARQLRDLLQLQQGQLVLAQQIGQATIDSFPDPVLVVNRQQEVQMANPVAPAIAGSCAGDRDWGFGDSLGTAGRDANRWPTGYRSGANILPQEFDKAISLRSGEEPRSYLPRIVPVRDALKTIHGATILLQDITRFRLLDEVKTNLVATVSHELKTPLTSIRLALHLLLEDATGPLLPKQLELLIDARDNAERILVMINNLLDLAQLEQAPGQLSMEPVRPAELLTTLAESFRARSQEQGIEFSLDLPSDLPLVAIDVNQFQHAVQNLFENSLAYTPAGGKITIWGEKSGRANRFHGNRHRAWHSGGVFAIGVR